MEGMPGESDCLRVQSKRGGMLHPRLNIDGKPIANKYRKGKTKSTLKRESKELEAVEREAIVDYRTIHLYRVSVQTKPLSRFGPIGQPSQGPRGLFAYF